MRVNFVSCGAWPWIFTALAWGLTSTLSCFVAESPLARREHAGSVASQILGKGTAALAALSYDRADTAFHMGRPAHVEKAFTNDVFQVWRREVAPVGHSHLGGTNTQEIMSWLRFATELDPHNMEYYLVAAFWLMSRDIGRPDQALLVLREARAKNPKSYLVFLGKARLYAKLDDRVMARRCYDRALVLWPGDRDPEDPETGADTKSDKRELLARRAILREMDGDAAGAISDMRDILRLFPDRPLGQFRMRIETLERGEKPADTPEQRWSALRGEEHHHFCEEECEAGHGGA